MVNLISSPAPAEPCSTWLSTISTGFLNQPDRAKLLGALEPRAESLPQGWNAEAVSHEGVVDTARGKVKFGVFFDHSPRALSYRLVPPPGFTGVAWLAGLASADGVNVPVGGANRIVLPASLREGAS